MSYKTIPVKKEIHKELKRRAVEHDTSIIDEIEDILKKELGDVIESK